MNKMLMIAVVVAFSHSALVGVSGIVIKGAL